MKNLLLLTTLFISLFISFTACSDKEEEIIDYGIEVSPSTPPENITFRVFYNESEDEYTLKFYESAETRLWIKLFGDTTVLGLECASKEVEDSIAKYVGGVIACDGNLITNYLPPVKHQFSFEAIRFRYGVMQDTLNLRKSNNLEIEPPSWFFQDDSYVTSRSSENNTGNYLVFGVSIHVVRSTNGVGLDSDLVSSSYRNTINSYFADNNLEFRFEISNIDYIDYLTPLIIKDLDISNNNIYNTFKNLKYINNTFNIYVLSDYDYNAYPDVYASTSKLLNMSIITGKHYADATVAHEMGHIFSLYDTHYGTADGTNPELVNGSNSSRAGDYIEDTPADPGVWKNGEYSGSKLLVDKNGDQYNPDPHNIMSISRNPVQQFSPNQKNKMRLKWVSDSIMPFFLCKRHMTVSGEPLGGAGQQHFSERTKTFKFKTVADDEEVKWVISKAGDGYYTSRAPISTDTVTGNTITISHNNLGSYFEVYAYTNRNFKQSTTIWKATAGVPSPAVGTLNWTAKGGTLMGSFPGYNPTITVFHDLDLSFNYTDFANPAYRSGMTYRVYTAYGGMYETSMDVVLSDMECSGGYIDVQVVDPCCGASNSMFRINCELRWDVYSLDIKDGQLAIDVKPATAQAATAEKASAKRDLTIKSIKLTTPDGRELVGRTLDTPQRKMSLSTAGMPKGQYQIEITDVEGNVHKARFGI